MQALAPSRSQAGREIDEACRHPDAADRLMALLPETAPIYAEMSTADAEWVRGEVLVRFQTIGLPVAALPFVIEELEIGQTPYLLAAAARALRVAPDMPAALPQLLLAAVERLRGRDDVVRFGTDAAGSAPVTALGELLRTLGSLGAAAAALGPDLTRMIEHAPPLFAPPVLDELRAARQAIAEAAPLPPHACCGGRPEAPVTCADASPATRESDLVAIEVQDQDGTIAVFGDIFGGRPSLVAFFYTRCMNPEKCALTITKLGRLRRRALGLGWQDRVTLAAFTYDPAFDLPDRLHAYGEARGLAFDARCRLLRTTQGFEPLRAHFDLEVGYGPLTVNQHRLDLVILDESCRPAARFARAQWSEDDALAALERVL